MSCVNSSCCCCQGSCQPVSSSEPAVNAAHCATVGTNDTINALIVNGSNALATTARQIAGTKQQAIKAQSQIAQSGIWAGTFVLVAVVAIIAFAVYAVKGRGRI